MNRQPHADALLRRAMLLMGSGLLGCGPSLQAAEGLPALDLRQMVLSFQEEFDTAPNVSAWGPSRWIAHTPWNGDFGEASFTDPGPGQAWHTDNGVLRITARQNGRNGRWTSGLLSSSDPAGRGFRQALGYFEARLRLPLARGVWPAFWLAATHPTGPHVEVDILEFYGRNTSEFRSVVHIWPNGTAMPKWGQGVGTPYHAGTRAADFNLYGALVTRNRIVGYFNREPVWQMFPPIDMGSQPLTLLVNLAMEPDAAPGVHTMDVDWVRAWAAL